MLSGLFYYKSTNAILMTSSKPNYLPKASCSNTITLGVSALTHEFGGDTSQSIANSHYTAYNQSSEWVSM